MATAVADFDWPDLPPLPDFIEYFGEDFLNEDVVWDGHMRFIMPGTSASQLPRNRPLALQSENILSSAYFEEGNRNAAVPPQRQEMESSSGAGAIAAQPTPFPNNPFTTEVESAGMTPATIFAGLRNMNFDSINLDQVSQEAKGHTQSVNGLQTSNVRESTGDQQLAVDSDAEQAANILRNGMGIAPAEDHNLGLLSNDYLVQSHGEDSNAIIQDVDDTDYNALSQDVLDRDEAAFAKIVFTDGDFFVKTHDVTVGRNPAVYRDVRLQQKLQLKADAELAEYRKEPSQPSQPGDGDQHVRPSASSQSLEGRPAPQSNVSEHGGMVCYNTHSDGEIGFQQNRSSKRRYQAKSSSDNSIAPSYLHAPLVDPAALNAYGEPEKRTHAFIEVHPQHREDITKISKEHLMFSFNFKEEQWELLVLGNRAFVNNDLTDKGQVVALEHNDEIMVASLYMVFKLPDNFRHSDGLSIGTFEVGELQDGEDDATARSSSPVRRLSNAMEAEGSDDGQEDEVAEDNRPKLKLKLGKTKQEKQGKEKAEKPSTKRPKKDSPTDIEQFAEALKKAEKADKVKKPKAAAKEPDECPKEEKPSPPTAPPTIDPSSALANVPVGELPEKRKGPGRPPKNGLVSKRDQAMVAKRTRDYEKRGEKPPPYDMLVAMVRRENKIKEQQQKMAANGTPIDASVMPSIEAESGPLPQPTAYPSTEVGAQMSTTPAEPARKGSPKPKRTAKSPSPFKPEADYTEEELKKPTGTYVHLLNEVLEEHPEGQADLQEIYDRLMKRWPYYKYRVNTTGWQSSVRHNLLQHDRFKESGKSGKGKFWAINPDVPMEKEKKRKMTPPIRGPMHNGQFIPPHLQFGQAQYGNPYAPHNQNGQPHFNAGPHQGPSGAYYSPYAGPGQHGAHNGQAQAGAGPNQYARRGQLAHAHQETQQQNNAPPTPYKPLVEEILGFQNRYLHQFRDNAELQGSRRTMVSTIIDKSSDLFHNLKTAEQISSTLETEEAKELFAEMNVIFQKHKDLAARYAQEMANGTTSAQQNVGNQVMEGGSAGVNASGAPVPVPAPGQASGDPVPVATAAVEAGIPSNVRQAGSPPAVGVQQSRAVPALEPPSPFLTTPTPQPSEDASKLVPGEQAVTAGSSSTKRKADDDNDHAEESAAKRLREGDGV
ncbi:hypothetical protein LTR37_019874 [Vermiconidia calcicola]|uniref:Uncharacterized protein n=1 Tax=Vermiconidia calcicola TaxID=1690605 RepID=A0ACC3MD40_9PEZI|nr:hypothetical protein LTR37_019874 [Vermiconidia calcicola]